MGKASKWFRGLLGLKKPESSQQPQAHHPTTNSPKAKLPKKKWSFVKSYREKEQQPRVHDPVVIDDDDEDPSKHAIAVAAATAAVAEAAVAAAQAAAEVVRLTSSGRSIPSNATANSTHARVTLFSNGNAVAAVSPANAYVNGGGYGNREEWAAVMIQSRFRAYLSRRALRALKALVKLQAIVRGRIIRRQNAHILRHLQRPLLRNAGRAGIFESPHKASYLIHYPGPATPEKSEHIARAKSLKHGETLMYRRNGSKNKSGSTQNCRVAFKSCEFEGSNGKTGSRYEEMNDKVLEIDNGKPQIVVAKRRNLFHSSHLSIGSDQYSHCFTTSKDSTAHQTVPSLSSFEVQSMSPLQFSYYVDEDPFCTAESSPQFHSTSCKGGENPRRGGGGGGGGGPLTPTRSDGSRSCLSGYSDCPNYMSCTESSKAKIRSLSAPRQRPQYERSSSTKRFSIGFGDRRMNPQRVSALHTNFASKAYPGSGRLDRLGMPIREEATVGFSGGLWHRF